MPITLACPCGKTLQVKDELAGKRIKCPGCGGVLDVQEELPELEPLDADPPDLAGDAAEPGPRAQAKKKKKKKKRARTKSREEVDEEFAEWQRRSYWRKRVFRGSAFIVMGLIIAVSGIYLLVWHPQDLQPLYSVFFLVLGIAAVVKGLVGMFFGEFFGEEE
jgi:hypothetical protein